MTNPPGSRLETLKQRHAKLTAQLARAEKAEREAARTLETRRKVIAGAVALALLDENPNFRAAFLVELHRRVTRPHDRAALADLLPPAG